MIRDLEKRKIKILHRPNAHFLITGKSGTGKTYYCCRKIEEELKKNKAILLIDFSSSYTEKELQKNKFQYQKSTEIFDISDGKGMKCLLDPRNMAGTVVDSLIHALDIKSYYQKKILNEAIIKTVRTFNCLKMEQLFFYLELMEKVEDTSAEYKKNVGHLLTRLVPYKKACAICFEAVKEEKNAKVEGLTIIQLSSIPELQRKFLTNFLLEIIWREIRSGSQKWDYVLLDEFQNLPISAGSALSAMLREGRKFGLGVWLSSQFLGNYSQDELDTLMQAGNMMFFKPVEREMKLVAGLIDYNEISTWKNILQNLKVGESVLKGCYCLDENKREVETPIICKVETIKEKISDGFPNELIRKTKKYLGETNDE
nr:DUF87 domain-containing protein [uncultured Blautia sp.]